MMQYSYIMNLVLAMMLVSIPAVADPTEPVTSYEWDSAIGDWDGDGHTDMFRYQETTFVDPATGVEEVDLAKTGVYFFDGWSQKWSDNPVIHGTGFSTKAVLDTPEGMRLWVTKLVAGNTTNREYEQDFVTGVFVEDTTPYVPPTATFQATNWSPVWPNQPFYGGNSNQNHGWSWQVQISPASQIEPMQVSTVCVWMRPTGQGGGAVEFCRAVDWWGPEQDNAFIMFDYNGGGLLNWSPVDENQEPLLGAWCNPDYDDHEWRAEVRHKGGSTFAATWAALPTIFSCDLLEQ